jgi:hypothetical protein
MKIQKTHPKTPVAVGEVQEVKLIEPIPITATAVPMSKDAPSRRSTNSQCQEGIEVLNWAKPTSRPD